MIERGREWQALEIAAAARDLASGGRVSMVDRAYYTGIADIMNSCIGEQPVVWPEKIQELMDRFFQSQ